MLQYSNCFLLGSAARLMKGYAVEVASAKTMPRNQNNKNTAGQNAYNMVNTPVKST